MKVQQVVVLVGLGFLGMTTGHSAGVRDILPPPPVKPKKVEKPAFATITLSVPKGTLPPNEVGVIPILEYHEISSKEKWMMRSIPNFRHDLERLYKEGYRPISMKEYLDNRIDLPAGMSPVLLTFDDARA